MCSRVSKFSQELNSLVFSSVHKMQEWLLKGNPSYSIFFIWIFMSIFKNLIRYYFYSGVYILKQIEGDQGGDQKQQTLTSSQHQTQEQQPQILLQTIEQGGQQFVVQTLEDSGNQYVIQPPQYVIQQLVQKPGHPPQIINQYIDNRKSPHNQQQYIMHPQVDMSQQNQQHQVDTNNQNQPKVVTQQLENSMQQPFLLQQLESKQQQQIYMMQQVEAMKNQQLAIQQLEANKQNQNFVQSVEESNQNQQQRLQQAEANKTNQQQVQFGAIKSAAPQPALQQMNKTNQQQIPQQQQQSQYVISQFQENKHPQIQQSQQPPQTQQPQQSGTSHVVLRHIDNRVIFQPQKVKWVQFFGFYLFFSVFRIFLI